MPTGKDEVKLAVLKAATDLFAERGPGAVSIRDIANRAKVNHGLIHRHFGSKDSLVQSVLDHLVKEVRERHQRGVYQEEFRSSLYEEIAQNETYWKVLARALLDGHTKWLEKGNFPLIAMAVNQLKEAMKSGNVDEGDAQAMVASYISVALGWLVFEPFISTATGMKGTAKTRRRRMLALWENIEKSTFNNS